MPPDKFKLSWKVLKYMYGWLYYIFSYRLYNLTKKFNKNHFGTKLPIDVQQTTGIFPTKVNVLKLYKFSKEWVNKIRLLTFIHS